MPDVTPETLRGIASMLEDRHAPDEPSRGVIARWLRAAADKIERLQAENAALKKTLEFYADSWQYHSPNQSMMGSGYPAVPKRPEICRDAGERARAALAPKEATEGGSSSRYAGIRTPSAPLPPPSSRVPEVLPPCGCDCAACLVSGHQEPHEPHGPLLTYGGVAAPTQRTGDAAKPSPSEDHPAGVAEEAQ